MENKKKILTIRRNQTVSFIELHNMMATIIAIIPSAVRTGTSELEVGIAFKNLLDIQSDNIGNTTPVKPDNDEVYLNELIVHVGANVQHIPLDFPDAAEIETRFAAGDDEFTVAVIYELREFTNAELEFQNLIAMQRVLGSEDLFQRIVETDDN